MGIPRDFNSTNVFDSRISSYYQTQNTEQRNKLREAYEKSLSISTVPPIDRLKKKKLAQKLKKDLFKVLNQMKDGLEWDAVVSLYSNQDDDILENEACYHNSRKFDSFRVYIVHL